jgi:hypothetical protein
MRFADYPDHSPSQPPSPEMLAILERFKALAATLDIKIEAPKRGHSGEVIDCPITLRRPQPDGPLVCIVAKNRPSKETP